MWGTFKSPIIDHHRPSSRVPIVIRWNKFRFSLSLSRADLFEFTLATAKVELARREDFNATSDRQSRVTFSHVISYSLQSIQTRSGSFCRRFGPLEPSGALSWRVIIAAQSTLSARTCARFHAALARPLIGRNNGNYVVDSIFSPSGTAGDRLRRPRYHRHTGPRWVAAFSRCNNGYLLALNQMR